MNSKINGRPLTCMQRKFVALVAEAWKWWRMFLHFDSIAWIILFFFWCTLVMLKHWCMVLFCSENQMQSNINTRKLLTDKKHCHFGIFEHKHFYKLSVLYPSVFCFYWWRVANPISAKTVHLWVTNNALAHFYAVLCFTCKVQNLEIFCWSWKDKNNLSMTRVLVN